MRLIATIARRGATRLGPSSQTPSQQHSHPHHEHRMPVLKPPSASVSTVSSLSSSVSGSSVYGLRPSHSSYPTVDALVPDQSYEKEDNRTPLYVSVPEDGLANGILDRWPLAAVSEQVSTLLPGSIDVPPPYKGPSILTATNVGWSNGDASKSIWSPRADDDGGWDAVIKTKSGGLPSTHPPVASPLRFAAPSIEDAAGHREPLRTDPFPYTLNGGFVPSGSYRDPQLSTEWYLSSEVAEALESPSNGSLRGDHSAEPGGSRQPSPIHLAPASHPSNTDGALLEEFRRELELDNVQTLYAAYCRLKEHNLLEHVSTKHFNQVLDVLRRQNLQKVSNEERPKIMRDILADMERVSRRPTDSSHAYVASCYSNVGDVKGFDDFVRELERSGRKPPEFQQVLRARALAISGRAKEAAVSVGQIPLEMLAPSRLAVIVNGMLQSSVANKDKESFERAAAMMDEYKVVMTTGLLQTVLRYLCEIELDAPRASAVLRKNLQIADTRHFNVVFKCIKDCALRVPEQSTWAPVDEVGFRWLVDDMRAKKLQFDDRTYQLNFDLWGLVGNLSEIIRLYDAMRQSRLTPTTFTKSAFANGVLKSCDLNNLAMAIADAPGSGRFAFEFFHDLLKALAVLDGEEFLSAWKQYEFYASGRNDTQRLEMIKLAIRTLLKHGFLEPAIDITATYRNLCERNLYIHNAFVGFYADRKEHNLVIEHMKRMRLANVGFDAFTIAKAISSCWESGTVVTAKVARLMRSLRGLFVGRSVSDAVKTLRFYPIFVEVLRASRMDPFGDGVDDFVRTWQIYGFSGHPAEDILA
ncbi:hypothetical protein HK101_005595 [Irineochytrium annulatum]|nr:hypothetical protein HK101_005595 [Irineochytrium annulatum]